MRLLAPPTFPLAVGRDLEGAAVGVAADVVLGAAAGEEEPEDEGGAVDVGQLRVGGDALLRLHLAEEGEVLFALQEGVGSDGYGAAPRVRGSGACPCWSGAAPWRALRGERPWRDQSRSA